MDEGIIAVVAAFLILFVPVAGLTLRFALKPLVDSIARIMEARAAREQLELLDRRLTLMEQEMQQVRHLAEGQAFDRTLEER
jgi:hypothetical protein